ncbi:hypothetical protein SUGI_0460160 [Cryptomeria japonica]|uniref:pentatricopeptide repeat-containing protein At5g15010, mitochondrial n=1 Tax=Cryptomeria japonica TaxID=3369 RepID=UPI002408E7ED|nr:pentatricopeptide repeat-containing protein At5g15010, mitochondrial [Cryptomeria japonica]GLJ24123.1 hypothetical protein SUGI_0460160 [Cryptomeria japonica]
MFLEANNSATSIFKLFNKILSIYHFQIRTAAKPFFNPHKPYLTPSKPFSNLRKPPDTNQKCLHNSMYLGSVYSHSIKNVRFTAFFSKRFHSTGEGVKNEGGIEAVQEISDCESNEKNKKGHGESKGLKRNVERVLCILRKFEGSSHDARSALEKSGLVATSDLVQRVLSRAQNNWQSAYTCFLWATSQPDYKHSIRSYHTMISMLGKWKQFDVAWALIRKMQGVRDEISMVRLETLLIMIESYSAARNVGEAVKTFYLLEKFKLKVDINVFCGLLSALCKYKNVEDAEQLLYHKKSAFAYETKSFNIVLNGWCNIIVSVTEAKRFWTVMIENGIDLDACSYGCMICCFSKAGYLNDVIRLFEQMKRRNYAPDLKVYNAAAYALAKEKCFKEAYILLNVMAEKGFTPNAVTYLSLIKGFCKAGNLKDAYKIFDKMIQNGLKPSITAFHAFFSALEDPKETMELFEKMIKSKCTPTMETFIMLIRKFCRRCEFEVVFKVWHNMGDYGHSPNRMAYSVLIHGLFLNGRTEEAHKYYEEMKSKGFYPDPATDKMLNAWIAGRELTAP